VHSQEAVREHTAREIRPKLALDESRHWDTLLATARKERLELLADDLMEQCTLRLVSLILDRAAPWRDRCYAERSARMVPAASRTLRGSGSPVRRSRRASAALGGSVSESTGASSTSPQQNASAAVNRESRVRRQPASSFRSTAE
jgi:hypothetical protein